MAKVYNQWKASYDSNRRYNSHWENTYPWLQKSSDGTEAAYCKMCHCTIVPRISNISNHGKSDKHRIKTQSKIKSELTATLAPWQSLDEELKLDLEEYEQLYKAAKRPRVQEHLLKEMDRLRREVLLLESKQAPKLEVDGDQASTGADKGDSTQKYEENITKYGFDQTKEFMELYLPLDNLGEISDENIETNFTDRSVTVKVHFPNKTCQLHIARLCEDIVPEDSYFKKKSKNIVVMLKKAEAGKTWATLTEREKKAKEKKEKPKFDEHEDPGASLTRLLKTMYDEGDDEMKRTISKAWYESQAKKQSGADPFADL